MDFFARLSEQAKDLWSKPAGKWLLGVTAAFLAIAVIFSLLLSRPTMVLLGTVDAVDAPKVAQRLADEKIAYETTGSGPITFEVRDGDAQKARLLMAELNLDPNSAIWHSESWLTNSNWSNTELDKRRLLQEQLESNLARAIRALSDIDNARVILSLPERSLFRDQEQVPKASVIIYPKQGRQLGIHVIEAIMETVAGAVEGMDRSNVVVVNGFTQRVESNAAFQSGNSADSPSAQTDQRLAIEKQYQDRWQQNLTTQLERVVGAGNVSVIVQPSFNWDRVLEEALDYTGAGQNGQGIVLSEQTRSSSSEGSGLSSGQIPAGTTPNADLTIPGYPGGTPDLAGNFSSEERESILNYLVNQTKRITDKPGGAIDEISVGILVNERKIGPEQEGAIASVVSMAMGSKARVEVRAIPFALAPWEEIPEPGPVTTAGTPNWLIMLLVAALTLGGIAFFFVFLKPRQPVLEPVFAGPEAAMMGGIPLNDPGESVLSEIDISQMDPEEIALLGDEFLAQMGIDPSGLRMREKVEKIAKGNPEGVASLIRTWMSEE